MTINFAHRGASGYYPENTMIAFQKAIEMGCDAIETDIHITSDGVLVLIHDDSVDRTTNGKGLVKDFTFEELRKLDAGSWYDKEYKSEKIPSVEELLKLAKDKNIIINFELKTNQLGNPEVEKKIIDLIKKNKMHDQVILSSFNHYSMVVCRLIDENIKTALLYEFDLFQPSRYCEFLGANALHPNFRLVNKAFVDEAHAYGVAVNPYTVNSEMDMENMLKLNVDGIITNYPDKLKFVMKKI